MAGPPSKIMIIRHGEKPPKSPGKKGPWDVLVDGQSGNGKSLIVPGWQRAGALNAFFAPYQANPADPEIAKPDYIYAADSQRGESSPVGDSYASGGRARISARQPTLQCDLRYWWRGTAIGEKYAWPQRSRAHLLGARQHYAPPNASHRPRGCHYQLCVDPESVAGRFLSGVGARSSWQELCLDFG